MKVINDNACSWIHDLKPRLNINILKNLKIDLNLRPHNLKEEIYYELTQEYEKL